MGRKRSSNDISMVSCCHRCFFRALRFIPCNEYTSFMDNTVYYLEFSFKELVPRKEIRDEGGDHFEEMSEFSEMTSMRLQMTMDRRSKFIETLSNIMKAIDSTQDTLVQNLK